MEDVESQGTTGSSPTAGTTLRQAREAAGLSRADIATRTKIAERHLLAIEQDRFNDLAARTYAVGFSRAYARALGLDEAKIAERVRAQLDAEEHEPGRVEPSFEPGDPARVPPSRMAWVAGAGVIVVIALLLAFWGNFLSPEGELPDLVAEKPLAPPGPAPKATVAPGPPAAPKGPVVMTATADGVWVKVTDASGAQLLQKELALGESWTVPPEAAGPQLRTGRPDALRFTVGGKPAPALADKPVTMSGISLAAADLLARGAGQGGPAPSPAPAMPTAAPTGSPPAPQTALTGNPAPRRAPTSVEPAAATPVPSPIAARPEPTPSATPAAAGE